MDDPLAALGALADPVRRALYRYVADSPGDVGREEAARGIGVSRSLAAYHLDRLVEQGLLAADYRRLSGRSGPGAGRPAKVYRRAEREVEVSLPPRDYRLAATVLSDALAEGGADHLAASAHRLGREMVGADPDLPLEELLQKRGFEPLREGGVVRLRNCPFRDLVPRHRDLVCGMNLALLEGALEGLDGDGWTARLEPSPDRCCVAFRRSDDVDEVS